MQHKTQNKFRFNPLFKNNFYKNSSKWQVGFGELNFKLKKPRSPPKKSKKNMTYHDAFKYYHLNPFKDTDRDGIPNWRDCRPFNPKKHGTLPPSLPVTTIVPSQPSTDNLPEYVIYDQPQQVKQVGFGTGKTVIEPQQSTPKRKLSLTFRRSKPSNQWDGLWRLYYRQIKGKWDIYDASPDQQYIFTTATTLQQSPYIAEVRIDKRPPEVMLKLLNRRLIRERVVGKARDITERTTEGLKQINEEALEELQEPLEQYAVGPQLPTLKQPKGFTFIKSPHVKQYRKQQLYTPPWLEELRKKKKLRNQQIIIIGGR